MQIVHRSQIQHQTIDNLVAADIIKPSEVALCYDGLSAMEMPELLAVLVESHRLRERFGNPLHMYVPMLVEGEICLN